MDHKFKQDKGVAGLTILLSLVVMLFVIGLLVMIFSIMGGKLQDSTFTSTSATKINETTGKINETSIYLSNYYLRSVACSVSKISNATTQAVVGLGNYTITNCNIKFAPTGNVAWNNTAVNVTYSYTYDTENTATSVINDTTSSIAGVTDWFDIFIVIGAMVVLILLTVLIITAIRGSGMISGGETASPNHVGSA